MAQLSSIIGSILRDIIAAQHEANLYSFSLSESYGKDGRVKDFQLPNVLLSDMEMDLRYGVLSTEEDKEEHNVKYSKFRQFLRELCSEAAKTSITCAVSTVLSSEIRREEEEKKFFYHLKQEEDLNKEFYTFLMRQMRQAFAHNLRECIDLESGTAIPEKITERLMGVVRKKFLDDTDLEALFAGSDGKQLKSSADENIQQALAALVKNETENNTFRQSKILPRLEVAITADELANMPEDAIHSFKLKFTPTSCVVTSLEEEGDVYDFVMK